MELDPTRAALDDSTPRVLRIAGGVASARDLVTIASEVTGDSFALNNLGSLENLAKKIAEVREASADEDSVFPQWQGMQYLYNMSAGAAKLGPLDNARYPQIKWTGIAAVLAAR